MITFILATLYVSLHVLECNAQDLMIDHIITLYPDINQVKAEFSEMGFNVKPGRMHENGLENAHLKFSNGSSVELMSLSEKAGDQIASNYEKLLQENINGAYLALSGFTLSFLQKKLDSISLNYEVTHTAAWTYLTFPGYFELQHVFFLIYQNNHQENGAFFNHSNGACAIKEVFIDGNSTIVNLLLALGVNRCTDTYTQALAAFNTKTGQIILTEKENSQKRYSINSYTLKTKFEDTITIQLD